METRKEVFQYLFILIVLCITILIISCDNEFKIQDNKKQIIDNCEQRFVGDYSKIKDCIDFELNYKR